MIRIIDYGVGNIQALITIFNRLGIPAKRAFSAVDMADATHIVLPGVGNFDHAMQSFNDSGMRPTLEMMVQEQDVPLLGICVGMHMLAESSDEGSMLGLGLVPGRVRAFAKHHNAAHLPMPHMGWNTIRVVANRTLFTKGFDNVPEFYFLHSFYFDAEDKADVVAMADYGLTFDCVVSRRQVYGVQFHPEKSHRWGAQILKNFAEI